MKIVENNLFVLGWRDHGGDIAVLTQRLVLEVIFFALPILGHLVTVGKSLSTCTTRRNDIFDVLFVCAILVGDLFPVGCKLAEATRHYSIVESYSTSSSKIF